MKKIILKNTMFCGLSTFIIGGIGFFILPFMVAKLGPEQYGLFAIVNIFAVTGYVSLFELGFQASVSRYVAKYNEEKRSTQVFSVVTTSLILFLFLSFMLVFVSWLLKGFFLKILHIQPQYLSAVSLALNWMFASYVFLFPAVVIMGYFQGLQRYGVLKIIEIISYLLYFTGIIIYLIYGGKNFIVLVFFNLGAQFLRAAVYFIIFCKEASCLTEPFLLFNTNELKKTWKMSKYLFITKPAGLFYHNVPRIFTAVFLGPIAMTGYEIIVKIPRVLKSGIGFLNSAVMPAASVLDAREDHGRLAKLFLLGVKYQVIFVLPIITSIFLFAKHIMHFWAPDEYKHLYALLQAMLVWNFISPLVAYTNSILTGMERKLKFISIWAWLSVFVSVVFTLLFIDLWGLKAVIWGYVLGVATWVPFVVYLSCKEVRILKKEFLMIFGNSFKFLPVPIFFYYMVRPWQGNIVAMLASVSICFVLFFAILFMFALTKDERQILLSSVPFFKEQGV